MEEEARENGRERRPRAPEFSSISSARGASAHGGVSRLRMLLHSQGSSIGPAEAAVEVSCSRPRRGRGSRAVAMELTRHHGHVHLAPRSQPRSSSAQRQQQQQQQQPGGGERGALPAEPRARSSLLLLSVLVPSAPSSPTGRGARPDAGDNGSVVVVVVVVSSGSFEARPPPGAAPPPRSQPPDQGLLGARRAALIAATATTLPTKVQLTGGSPRFFVRSVVSHRLLHRHRGTAAAAAVSRRAANDLNDTNHRRRSVPACRRSSSSRRRSACLPRVPRPPSRRRCDGVVGGKSMEEGSEERGGATMEAAGQKKNTLEPREREVGGAPRARWPTLRARTHALMCPAPEPTSWACLASRATTDTVTASHGWCSSAVRDWLQWENISRGRGRTSPTTVLFQQSDDDTTRGGESSSEGGGRRSSIETEARRPRPGPGGRGRGAARVPPVPADDCPGIAAHRGSTRRRT